MQLSRIQPLQVSLWPAWAQTALAFALGAAGVLAFAPFSQGLLLVPVLALLLHLLWHASGSWAGWRIGYAFGLGLMGFGVFWVRISINQFGGVTPSLAVLFSLLFVAIVALYFALFGALVRAQVGGSKKAWLIFTVPASWVLVEWLRGWLFSGFPWLGLGYSQIDLPLGGYAPMFGVLGVSLLVMLSAGLLLAWRQLWPLVLLLALWLGGWLARDLAWTNPVGAPVAVTLVQGNIPQAEKWQRSRFESTLATYLGLSRQTPDARLVVWPETAIPGFAGEIEHSVLRKLNQQFKQQGQDLLTGIIQGERRGAYYNSMISLGVSGRDGYAKRHLVPFGEFLPIKPLLDPVLDFLHIPMSDFTPGGDAPPIVQLAGHPVAVNICYEDAFANEVLRGLPVAEFLINASNDAWFGDSLAPHQHLQIARMRSLETGRVMLRATNTGISAVIGYQGQLLATAPQFEQAILAERIQPRQGQTPYARFGDVPILALALAALVPGLLWRRIARRRLDHG